MLIHGKRHGIYVTSILMFPARSAQKKLRLIHRKSKGNHRENTSIRAKSNIICILWTENSKYAPKPAASKDKQHWIQKIILTDPFNNFSNEENLYLAAALFCITLVSCPVKTTTPKTLSVFLKLIPLNN